jgi:hypothetical protein
MCHMQYSNAIYHVMLPTVLIIIRKTDNTMPSTSVTIQTQYQHFATALTHVPQGQFMLLKSNRY